MVKNRRAVLRTPVDELASGVGSRFPDGPYTTVAGLILDLAGNRVGHILVANACNLLNLQGNAPAGIDESRERVGHATLLDAHGVDAMVSGHIHNFQHIQMSGSDVDYFVNTSASLTRQVIPLEGALFASPDPGFTLCTVKDAELIMTFVNDEGRIVYQYSRTKQP